jgi:CDP-alcohol phosphatidyltransferase
MLGKGWEIYKATRKKHDLVFNVYLMRPIAAQLVALLAPTGVTPNQITIVNLFMFIVAGTLLIALPTWVGGLIGIGVLEASYCLDCVDGMLARHKKIASKEGHLFDFFTDELKALLLAAALGIRLWRSGGLGIDGRMWEAGSPAFLLAGIAGAVTLASAVSLTNFVRHPALSGKETTVEALRDERREEGHLDGGPDGANRDRVPTIPEPLPEPPVDLRVARTARRLLLGLRRDQSSLSRARVARDPSPFRARHHHPLTVASYDASARRGARAR